MKSLLSHGSILILAVTIIAGCQQNPSSTGMPNVQLPLSAHGGSTADAHPAWTFMSSSTSRGHTYSTVAVSDSDGTDNANVYTASSVGLDTRFPSWSANGSSISFVEAPARSSDGGWLQTSVWGACSIKAVDVSVSSGLASGSNARNICSYSLADSVKIIVQAWCPASGVNKIAFIAITPTEEGVYTVSSSGGTPAKIYSVNLSSAGLNPGPLVCGGLTWSNDGTKIAFVESSPVSTPYASRVYMIRIIDLTGAVQVTLDSAVHVIGGLKWSNAGLDKIALYSSTIMNTADPKNYDLYTIATTAGSTASLVKTAAHEAFWSPDNSEVVCTDYSSTSTCVKIDVASGTKTTVGGIPYGDWKRP
jgi:hypothetical protein